MALVDPCSGECAKSELELFDLPPTQTSIEETRLEHYHPLSSLDGDGQIEFKVTVGSDEFIDPSEVFIYTKNKIVDERGRDLPSVTAVDNAAVPDDSVVYPVNYFNGSQFKSVEYLLNDKQIANFPMYHYRAIIEALVSYQDDVKLNQLRCAMFERDVGNFDCTDPLSAVAAMKNAGATARWEHSKFSRSFESLGKVHGDLFEQPKLLLNGMSLGVRFQRTDPKFLLMAKTANKNFKIVVEKAILVVGIRRVSAHVREPIEAQLVKDVNAKYNLRRVETKFFSRAAGLSDLSIQNLSTGQLPSHIILAFVETEAFNGSTSKNPFKFQNFKITNISLEKNGQNSPFKPLVLNFEEIGRETMMAYLQFQHSLGFWNRNKSNGIDPRGNYLDGETLFAVNLSQDLSTCGNLNLVQEGIISLTVRLKEALAKSVTIIVYLTFPSTILEINRTRDVYYNE